MEMTARGGLYDAKTEMLTLGQSIVLTSTTGFEGHLTEAVIDIRNGKIVSEKPVEIKTLQGKLNANRLEVTDAGNVALFENGVSMIVNPAAAAGKPAEATDTKTVTE
jgi:lipopolysaccharide export system protein LptC